MSDMSKIDNLISITSVKINTTIKITYSQSYFIIKYNIGINPINMIQSTFAL